MRFGPRLSALLTVLVVVFYPGMAWAYIGPGAGFAFAGSLLVLLVTFALALVTIFTWPATFLYRLLRVGNPYKNAQSRRVVVLGLDGMDPGMALRLIQEGRLPNFERLAREGVFRTLDTTLPSMSPVAWSTFATGVDPSHHRIFDFLTRDPYTYMAQLSSTEIENAKRVVNIGPYLVPLSRPQIRLLQRSEWFWKYLGDRHISSIIQRVPITFPPKPFRGLLLSGMCVPDLRGTQGTFSFFSTRASAGAAVFTGGEQTILRRKGNRIRSRIVGPPHTMLKTGGRMTLPFTLTVAEDNKSADLEIEGVEPFTLRLAEYSEWKTLRFKAMPGVTVSGIARFYLTEIDPEVSLYVTPIHIDPENPAMPISHPKVYSVYLAKKQGPYATLGLAEDTWALNERVIDEKAFLEQAMILCNEREKMFFDAIEHTRKGLVATVFDTTDRIQHMFYRYLDPDHPANRGKDTTEHQDAIARVYQHMDALLGKTLEAVRGTDTTVMVISDHGFTNFRRGVNLNAWLRDEGYLVLKEGSTSADWFANVDWSATRAFSLGLVGLFINRQGRERSGVVAEGEEYRSLVAEIATKLVRLVDPKTQSRAIRRVEAAHDFYDGPFRFDAPDLLVGYEGGYRNSWECAKGAVTEDVFCDNTKSWSGDHCVDPSVVPGVLFCNRRINTDRPRLIDIPYSIMKLFGQQPPRTMQGKNIFPPAGERGSSGGMLDPETLEPSGAAPDARAHSEPHGARRVSS